MSVVQWAWWLVVLAGVVPFADAMRLTVGATYTVQRSRARLVLAAIEVLLFVAWAVLHFGLRADRHLVPAGLGLPAGIVGLALTAACAGLFAWAKLRLGRWFSGTFGIKAGHQLVTDGPYAVTRHPMYTGVIGAVAGGALVWDSLLLLALAVALVAPLGWHTRIEERMFVEGFGDEYRRYQARVPRLLPRPFGHREVR
jgi:protein-S-isoprenylcysteine O-methyltransferase Ste14